MHNNIANEFPLNHEYTFKKHTCFKLNQQKNNIDSNECTFHPEINQTGTTNKSLVEAPLRLFAQDPRAKLKEMAEINKFKKEEEEKSYSYSPMSYTKVHAKQGKCMALTQLICEINRFPQNSLYIEPCSFHPQINTPHSSKAHSQLLVNYLSCSPYERLSSMKLKESIHGRHRMSETMVESHITFNTPAYPITAQFYDRLHQYEEIKMQNYVKIDSEMNKELTLSPRIN